MKIQKAFKKAIRKGEFLGDSVFLINKKLMVIRINKQTLTIERFEEGKRTRKMLHLDDILGKDWTFIDVAKFKKGN